ncbi:MAG: hypothetical protein P8Z49_11460 [Acidobacteriota bacterium]|jgi:hypothetical protein
MGEGAASGTPKLFPGAGSIVVAYLREPREKVWGALLGLDAAGVWLRGIELASFEDWMRQEASDSQGAMGLSTFFVPFLRVEKLVVDEDLPGVPSLSGRYRSVTGRPAETCFGMEAGGAHD